MILESLNDDIKLGYPVSRDVGMVFHGNKHRVPEKSKYTCKGCGNKMIGGTHYITTYESRCPHYHLDCYYEVCETILKNHKEMYNNLLKLEVYDDVVRR